MNRYKYTKLKNLGPVHGFTINTPDDRTLKDIYPQFIVRELNAANHRINRLEEALRRIANQDYRGNRSTESQIAFDALKEDKP